MDKIRQGDEQAAKQFFEQYKNLVYKTALLMLQNHQDVEEVLQEVFISVFQNINEYDPTKAKVSTWIYRITTNRCLNYIRRQERRPRLTPWNESLDRRTTRGPEEYLSEKQFMARALSLLSPGQRAVVVLRYFWNLPSVEVAEILDISPGTVKSRTYRALSKLRDHLGQKEKILSPLNTSSGKEGSL
jgi:RNA polymerase sigma-70 factor (ECF subfamily)